MLHINIHPPADDKFRLYRILRKNKNTRLLIKEKLNDNVIAAFYDEGFLCGGALIFGNKKAAYLYCFFENSDYCSEESLEQIQSEISSLFRDTTLLFDAECITGSNLERMRVK